MCRNLDIWGVFSTNQVQMRQRVVGCWLGVLQVLLGLWFMSEVCSLSVLGSCLSHSLLVPVLIYCSATMIWKEKEESRVSTLKINNL